MLYLAFWSEHSVYSYALIVHYETHEFHKVAKERNSHNFGVLRGILDVVPYPWVWNPNHDLFTRGISPVFGVQTLDSPESPGAGSYWEQAGKRPVLLLFRATNLAPIRAWTCPNNVLTITLSYDPNVNRSVFHPSIPTWFSVRSLLALVWW